MVKIVSALLALFISTVALAQDTAPPVDPAGQVQPIAANEASGEEIISEIQKFLKPFEYDRQSFRDPFEAQGSANPLKPGQVYGPFLPLQNYKLTEFQLRGLLWSSKNPVAIFKGPDGKDHRLTIKDYIGENFGYIATIREKEVVVIQTIEENEKRYSTTKVVFLE